MKKLLILVLLCAGSCTAPTQPIASSALDRGVHQQITIVDDLLTSARQAATEQAVAEARAAAMSQSPDAAQAAVQKALTEFDKLTWLQIQHERALTLIRVGQRFVWSQKGIFDIWSDELSTAKKNVDMNTNSLSREEL